MGVCTCGFCNVWVFVFVGFLTIERVFWLYVFLYLLCFCIVYFMYIHSFLLLR